MFYRFINTAFGWAVALFTLTAATQIPTLQLNKPLTDTLAGGQTREYQVTLAAGEFMQVRVEQQGIDVVVILLAANGQELARMDSPNEKQGTEILSWVAASQSNYRVKIQSFDTKAAAGQYSLTLTAKRPATTQDKRRIEIEKLFAEGVAILNEEAQREVALTKLEAALRGWQELSDHQMVEITARSVKFLKASIIFATAIKLANRETAEAWQAALPKLEEARKLYQELGLKLNEATCLAGLGKIYQNLGKQQESLRYYTQALPIVRELKDKRDEAWILKEIGKAYSDLDLVLKALEHLKQALVLYREISDEDGERETRFEIDGHQELEKKIKRLQIAEIESKPEFKEAVRLAAQDTTETLKAAIVKFEEAKRISQTLGYKLAEAHCLTVIGKTFVQLGESDNAIARYSEALIIYQSIPEYAGEKEMLSTISAAPLVAKRAGAKLQRRDRNQKAGLHPTLVVKTGHSDGVNSIAFSPDGKMLASGSGNIIKLWDVATKQEVRSLPGHSGWIKSVVFSPDGKLLASGTKGDKIITLWDVATGQEVRSFLGEYAVAFSPDGKMLVSDNGKTIRLWDISTGQEVSSLSGHSYQVTSVAFSPGGKILASGSGDKTIKLWDVATGQELHSFIGHSDIVYSVTFSPDGKMLASGSSNVIKLWDVATRQEIRSLSVSFSRDEVVFSPDGKLLAITRRAIGMTGNFRICDVATGEVVIPGGHYESDIHSVAFSPNGKMLASGGNGGGEIELWDVATWKVIATFKGHANQVTSIAFSSGGKILASNGETLGLSPDGKMLVSRDETIRLWDVATGQELRSSINPNEIAGSLAFSPDGKILASCSYHGTTKLWDVATGRELRTLITKPPWNRPLFRIGEKVEIIFSPDGKMLVLVVNYRKFFKVWDVATWQELSLPDTLPDWAKLDHRNKLVTINGRAIRADIEEGNKVVLVDTATEIPLVTLIALDQKDWVVVDEEGRFDASEGALQLMHYSYGLDVINLEQLRQEYYEPHLLQKLLGFNREPLRAVVPLLDVKLPPDVREQKLSPNGKQLTLQLVNRGGCIGKIEIFLNEKLIIPDARNATLRQNPNTPLNEVISLTVELPASSYLPGKANNIKVVTSNYLDSIKRGNIQSRGSSIVYQDTRNSEDTLPSVYALVSGVSDYEGDALDLRFAAKDAEDFAAALLLGARRLFCPPGNLQCLDKVNITTLSTNRTKAEEQPTKENFKRALGAIARQAKPEDIVVIYLAGHGVSLGVNTDTYFYLTKEAKSAAREDLTKNYQTVAISSEELRDWLTQTEWRAGEKGLKPLKQVLILDTCAAGAAATPLALTAKRELSGDQIRAIEFLKDKTGTFVLMGSAADAPSYEASRYGQGLLTYALLQGMKGAALDKGEFVDVQTLFSFAQKEVPRLAANIGGIQRPIISAPLGRTFVIGQMTDAEKGQVRLPSPKPLLLRPLLTNPETGDDDLKLIPALRKRLDAESSYELMKRSGRGEPTLVYVDDDSFPEALRLTGTYTMVGDKVRVKAFLRKDGQTVTTLAEILTNKETVVDELVNAVRNQLGQLR